MVYRRIPSLNWLRVFEAAASTESFAAAGRRLNMSSAAVSQQINALEGHLGARLFERGPRSVTLTAVGHDFLPAVRQGLLAVETSAASIFGQHGTTALSVSAPTVFAMSWLAPRLAGFTNENPDVRLSLICHDGIGADVGTDAHFSVVFGPAPRDASESHRLFGETVYPVAISHIADHIREPSDFLKHRLIDVSLHESNWLRLLEPHVDLQNFDMGFCHVNATNAALSLAGSGYGIALARAPSTSDLERAYGLVRCLDDLEMSGENQYRLTRPAGAQPSRAAERFRRWILREATA